MFRSSLAAATIALALASLAQPVVRAEAAQTSPAADKAANTPMRNQRYCEVLPITLLGGPTASVYNTVGHGDCPEKLWKALTPSDVRRKFQVLTVEMNGPRYFVMDRILPSGATKDGEAVELGGMTFVKRAEVKLSLEQIRNSKPYTPVTIDRSTVYRFDAGKPTFQLKAPDGSIYVMQSYARIIDPKLSYKELPALGSRLKLPAGWTYSEQVPAKTLMLVAKDKATVVQDDLKNTYQKLTPTN
ncbi:hypothetical protein [Segnochrobactrum spirostomi]|uniref:hypothetical protein n=1 Tax=Segnochrobactrum spirostomi TaxID=2608987 RepID=UPI0035E3FAE2